MGTFSSRFVYKSLFLKYHVVTESARDPKNCRRCKPMHRRRDSRGSDAVETGTLGGVWGWVRVGRLSLTPSIFWPNLGQLAANIHKKTVIRRTVRIYYCSRVVNIAPISLCDPIMLKAYCFSCNWARSRFPDHA